MHDVIGLGAGVDPLRGVLLEPCSAKGTYGMMGVAACQASEVCDRHAEGDQHSNVLLKSRINLLRAGVVIAID